MVKVTRRELWRIKIPGKRQEKMDGQYTRGWLTSGTGETPRDWWKRLDRDKSEEAWWKRLERDTLCKSEEAWCGQRQYVKKPTVVTAWRIHREIFSI